MKGFLDTRGEEAGPGGAGLLGAALLDAPHHGRTQLCSGAEGVGAAGIALESGGGVGAGSTISCSTTDWPAELDGGPGGSDAVGALARDMDRLAGSESGSDAEPSDWVHTLCTW